MWPVLLVLAAIVISIGMFGGWIFAVPLALVGAAALWFTRSGRSGDDEGVDALREEGRGAAPLDDGGVEFTDRDRETLGS